MRVIFVGIHNKPNKQALDSSTKTGKIVDEIISKLPDVEVVKTNLLNVDYMPKSIAEIDKLRHEWYWTHLPCKDDIIVLFGDDVRKYFNHDLINTINLNHPASVFGAMHRVDYINNTSELIISKIKEIGKLNSK